METKMISESAVGEINEIKIHGRTTDRRDPLTLFWTASGFEVNVTGSELWVEVESTYEIFEPWFSYTVNGDWIGRQMLPKGRYWVPLFRGMSPEPVKNVRFYKDLQAMSDDGESFIHIHALRYDGEFLPVNEKERKVEFIGDSITSGEGTFGAKEETDWIPMFFSVQRGYAHLTAKALDAEYRIFSQSGFGIHHGWDNNLHSALPRFYREVCSIMPGETCRKLGGGEKWNFESWQPDVVVINLGTNDVSGFKQPMWTDEKTGESYKAHCEADGSMSGEDLALIREGVKNFLTVVRECNPEALIIWCYGMLGYELQETLLDAIAAYRRESGDKRVCYLSLPEAKGETLGSREHPGYPNHQQAAGLLANFIQDKLAEKF